MKIGGFFCFNILNYFFELVITMAILKKFTYQQYYAFFICGVIIGVFFSPAINSISNAALVITWLIEGNYKTKWNKLKSDKAFWALMSVFFIHIIGLLYTENFEYALKDLKIKLPILLLPIVFASAIRLNQKQFNKVLEILVLTALVSSLYAFYIYVKHYGTDMKELREISSIISHIRLSLLNAIASFAAFYLLFIHRKSLFSIYSISVLVIGIWLFIFNGILGARMGILVYFVMAALFAFYLIYTMRKWWLTISLLIGVLALPVITYLSIPSVKIRVNEIQYEVNNYNHGGDPSGQSIGQRFVFWKIAVDIFKTSPIYGIGTGDVKDAYTKYYDQHPTIIQEKFQHRAHNQYLTILFTFGIIGFVVFMYGIISPMFYLNKQSDYFYVIFIISFLLSMTMEDTIETQAGVTFYAFFNALFLYARPKEEEA